MKLKRFLLVFLALAMVLSMTLLSAILPPVVTGGETIVTCFPNKAFGDAVISAYSGSKPVGFTDELTEVTPGRQALVDALAAFKGTVKVQNKASIRKHII